MYSLPTISLVVGAALIDSINPFAIGLFIMIIGSALSFRMSAKRIFVLGATYIASMFFSYLVLGLAIDRLLSMISPSASQFLSIVLGLALVIIALIEIRDFFWHDDKFSLQVPKSFAKKIKKFLKSDLSILSVALLGIMVAIVELPSTGAPYIAIISILELSFNVEALLLLALYNFILILPLLVILVLVSAENRIAKLAKWRESSREFMHLATGILLLILGWVLLLGANGTLVIA